MAETQPSRRSVLVGFCALTAAGITGLTQLSPAVAATAVKVRADGKVDVRLSALRKNGAVVSLPTLSAALVRVSPKKYVAYNLHCTHMGVPVQPSGSVWICPAHGSEFDPKSGRAVRGPAQSPLAHVPVRIKAGVATVG